MELLSRDAVFGVDDRYYEIVEVPEWGGSIRIRSLTGNERDRYEQTITETRGSNLVPKFVNARARLVAWTAVDANGARLFTDADIGQLGRKSAAALERVFAAARKLSGMSERDIEELEGNSDGGQSDGSISDSPLPSAAPLESSSTASTPES